MQSKTKIAFKRIGIALLWSGVLIGFMVLLVAAVREKDHTKCKGLKVTLKGDDRNAFIDEKDIKALINNSKDRKQNPVGMLISDINIGNLERIVERDPWVRSAELFIDNNEVLNIEVVQRDPLARVFTFSGNSFYLDEQGERIPVSDRFSARVPVFTGFPTDAVQLKKEDSLLYTQMGEMARFIATDTFWNAQVEQVIITGDRKFEFIPKLGDHVIVFGEGTDIATKFNKLLIFYREGLNKAGWNTYSRLNIAYHEEVIGTRRDGKSAPPPPMYKDSTVADVAVDDDDHSTPAPATTPKPAAAKPKADKPTATKKPAARKPEKKKAEGPKPKAVYNKPNRNRN
ncbi:hypothetical protein AAHN97_00215 [Chitinophaga niabensis]|uniref:cell division protein FtsQ/DivIB n=1 Tax=Chitinophaga niabensis TaxID=536979 RepID=UPI0031BAEF80